ncbi:MAG: histidine kinase [Panacibacter sp.]
MEFDNDRILRPINKIEIAGWIILCLMNPVVNWWGIFHEYLRDHTVPVILDLLVIIIINILFLPVYVLYARLIVSKFLFRKRYIPFALLSIALFLIIQALLYLIYSIVLTINDLTPPEFNYVSHSYGTFIREGLWIIINMLFAGAICFVRETMIKEDTVATLQKDNNFFKLRYLRSQLNPHFLFNTLNSIYSLSLQKSEQAPEAVVKLADVMRYLIYECNENKIPLDKEIDFIGNYIEIEKIRFNADIRFTVEGETEGIMIEPFLFISFIENGFKHALDNTEIKPFIYITIKVKPEEIILNVINNTNIDLETHAKRINGKGITGSKNLLELLYPAAYTLDIIQTDRDERQESKVRLKNARERLEILYPDAHTLDVILKNNVFTVSLIIKKKAA